MKIAIIGAGAYGTALSINFAANQHNVTLVPRRIEHALEINQCSENQRYLPNVKIPNTINVTSDTENLGSCDVIFFASPAQMMEASYQRYAASISPTTPVVICSKGISIDSLKLPTEILKNIPQPLAVFSGPHFAKEVANLKPSAVTLASKNKEMVSHLAQHLSSPILRVYPETDMLSVQIAGALKNVIAIATGIARGLDMGENAVAALITRGLAEMRRLGVAMGGRAETFLGLSGVGDLTLTCSSLQSRNTTLGIELAQGKTLNNILKHRVSVAEGVYTAKAAYQLMKQYDLHMPISNAVYEILYANKSVKDVITTMMASQTQWEQH